VVLRMNRDDTASWHTGGTANQHGLGVCFQGDHSSGPKGLPLSESQKQIGAALLLDLRTRHDLDASAPVAWHAVAQLYSSSKGKPSCPGAHTLEWLTEHLRASGLPVPGETGSAS
jgi:hypothetical protein